jgi:hypothetical protein
MPMSNYLTFNSYAFLFVFLPIVVAGYWALRRTPYVNWWVAAASLYFYATAGVVYLIPLLFTCFFDFYIGQKLVEPMRPDLKKALFVGSVTTQIFILCVCKYLGWLTGSLNQLGAVSGLNWSIPVLTVILPPGISFYELLRGQIRLKQSPLDFADPRFELLTEDGRPFSSDGVKMTDAWIDLTYRKTRATEFRAPYDHLLVDDPAALGEQLSGNFSALSRRRLSRSQDRDPIGDEFERRAELQRRREDHERRMQVADHAHADKLALDLQMADHAHADKLALDLEEREHAHADQLQRDLQQRQQTHTDEQRQREHAHAVEMQRREHLHAAEISLSTFRRALRRLRMKAV